jgi:hypothetical protein
MLTYAPKGNTLMNRFASLAVAAGLVVICLPAFAQLPPPVPPVLENRIPAPQLPAVNPPVINGPLSEGRDPPAEAYHPPQLNTFSNRVTHCLNEGTGYGLQGTGVELLYDHLQQFELK